MPTRWLKSIAGLLNPSRASIRGLYEEDQMRMVLDRERSRSDRTGVVFSLLMYSFSGNDRVSQLRALVRILRRRLRSTDEAGWLDGGRLGVVLLDARHEGASKVADDVRSAWPAGLPCPTCEICTYPNKRGDESRKPDSDLPVEQTSLDGSAGRERAAVVSGSDRAIDTLFQRHMPTWKRALDIAGASAALALFSPVLAAACLAVKLSSRGPVIFSQQRAGLGGKPFTMYKFRTMVIDAEEKKASLQHRNEQDGPAFKLKDDPRITRIGHWLRKTSIDELPQLLNILFGDMSLVGPRPLPVEESNQCRGWHRRRLEVTPGLTCIWQVRGRSQVTFLEWMRMDLAYVRSRSLPQDLKLIAMTVPAVLLRKGAR